MSGLSDDVTRLVRALATVEALDALVLLARTPDRGFTLQEVVAELHSHATVESTLDRLATLNLVDVRIGSTLRYRYRPTSPQDAATIVELLRAYENQRMLVLETLLALPPSGAMRAFADAFRFRTKRKGRVDDG